MPVHDNSDEDYREFIGLDIPSVQARGITAFVDHLKLNKHYGGYGICDKRGCLLWFDSNMICCRVVVEFDEPNSHSFSSITHGSNRQAVRDSFGRPTSAGWQMVSKNWFIPELVDVYRNREISMEVIYSMTSSIVKLICVEKVS